MYKPVHFVSWTWTNDLSVKEQILFLKPILPSLTDLCVLDILWHEISRLHDSQEIINSQSCNNHCWIFINSYIREQPEQWLARDLQQKLQQEVSIKHNFFHYSLQENMTKSNILMILFKAFVINFFNLFNKNWNVPWEQKLSLSFGMKGISSLHWQHFILIVDQLTWLLFCDVMYMWGYFLVAAQGFS